MAPKTLVTGAGGFIGSAVVRRLLARKRAVRCYLKPGEPTKNLDGLDVEIIYGDVGDRAAVARALEGCDVLYHLAAIYSLWLPDPAVIYEVNVEGSKTVLWAAYKAKLRKVVYTSSVVAVGHREDGTPADETVPFHEWEESNAYIRSKWLSERDALRFAREGLPLTVVNPALPFGERDIGPTPTGRLLLSVLKGQSWGYMDGGFCAIDVDDLAEGHLLAEEKGRVGERYILGNHNITYQEFGDLVAEAGGVKAPARHLPSWFAKGVGRMAEYVADHYTHRPPVTTYKAIRYGLLSLYYDNAKAKSELGLPQTPLRATIEKSVRWFRDHGYV
ncbi:MAG TPA: NAD-dependent epimerase/dehydratase family protein [Polyangia bacterium]|nr:NAD-dependent epimerase/dehydratase family protein [Polyangia bacterium]